MLQRLISEGLLNDITDTYGLFVERALPFPFARAHRLPSDEQCIGIMNLIGETITPAVRGRRMYGTRDSSLYVYDKETNAIFARFEIRLRMTGGQVWPIESPATAETISWPMLLPTIDPAWTEIGNQFARAMAQQVSDPPGAVASAAQSVESTLLLIGCRGRSLGELIDDFGRRFDRDSQVKADTLKALASLVARLRMTGNAHGRIDPTTAAAQSEARLMVNAAGGWIRYLYDVFGATKS